MNTVIYLIRHSKTLEEKGIMNIDEESQIINEKEILSIEGEKLAYKLSQNKELLNVDILWSSSYVRAKQTAKYITEKNNLSINLDSRLNERKLGNMSEIAKIMKNKETREVSREQLLDQNLKTSDGESVKETNLRMTSFFNEILEKYTGKRIAIISHGGSIKFYLLNYCKVNSNVNLEYEGKELEITSPCLLKLTFNGKKLLNIEQIVNNSEKNWDNYQNKTYNKDVQKLLKEFLNTNTIKTAIDLGCGSGNETVYMAKKGIKVLSIDRQLKKNFILDRLSETEKNNVKFKECEFENIEIPKTDAIMAFFSIPFCNPKEFNKLWNEIYKSLNKNGYFIGQLFGDRDDWKNNQEINTFSIEEVKEYLKKYKVIKLDEIEYIRQLDNKKWHFYNIIAQK